MIDTIRFDAEPDDMTLDIYVTVDGVPMSATFSVLVSGHDDLGKHHAFRAQTDFRCSRFGAKLAISISGR